MYNKNPEKSITVFIKNINQHSCFNIDNNQKCCFF